MNTNFDSSRKPCSTTIDSFETQHDKSKHGSIMTNTELLHLAREARASVKFESLTSKLVEEKDWKFVKDVGEFSVFRRYESKKNNSKRQRSLEVMCVGKLNSSLEEIASILHPSSEAEHNTVMSALYPKSFIFGSYERDVCCTENQVEDENEDVLFDYEEQLGVKTNSFFRTTLWGHNEQWCYFDYFRHKKERNGFMILNKALPPTVETPGRIVGENYRVDQLHGLNTSYLVERIPYEKGARVVFHAWFDLVDEGQDDCASKRNHSVRNTLEIPCSKLTSSSSSPSDSVVVKKVVRNKSRIRRLLVMAHGVTKLPRLVRRRRFGVQVPIDMNAVQVVNTRCPCCTHSLKPVKMSLAMAASAFTHRSRGSMKPNTKRCYLCGYLVCVECWSAENMECTAGRVAVIVVCTRCRANVQACEYSEVFAESASNRGPPRVVSDGTSPSTVSLLVDFLSTSLLNSAAGSSEHAAVMAVIRTLLRQNSKDFDGGLDADCYGEDSYDFVDAKPKFQFVGTEAIEKVAKILSDEDRFTPLEACKLGNAEERNYVLELPADPHIDVPRWPIPSNEDDRITSAAAFGILELANRLAPTDKNTDLRGYIPDTKDLDLLCKLAVMTMNCSYSFVLVMAETHGHVLASTLPAFSGAAVPREQTNCQHTLMSTHPFMVAHHEADVRFQNQTATNLLPVRFYVGFPVMIPPANGQQGDPEVIAGTLCCVDSKPRAEITRTQYVTMIRLARTAKTFLIQKGRLLQQKLNEVAKVQEK